MKGAITHRKMEQSKKSKQDKKKPSSSSYNSATLDSGNGDEMSAISVLGDENENSYPLEDYLIDDEAQGRKATLSGLAGLARKRQFQNWETLTARLLRTGYWSRLGDLAKSLNTLPDDIETIYNKLGKNMENQIESDKRLLFYKEFIRTALGSMVLRFAEVEALIVRLDLADHINRIELCNLMNSKLEAAQKADEIDFFDFELFASVVCDLYDEREKMSKVSPSSMRTSSRALEQDRAPERAKTGRDPSPRDRRDGLRVCDRGRPGRERPRLRVSFCDGIAKSHNRANTAAARPPVYGGGGAEEGAALVVP